MKLVHLSDIHIHSDTILGSDPVEHFKAVLDHVSEYHADADKVVITGDLTHYGHSESYQQLKVLLHNSGLTESLSPRLLVGNHDNRDEFLSVFPDTACDSNGFVQSVEATDIGWFVYLDTLQAGTHAGHLCSQRMVWLEEVLFKARAAGTAVWLFMHHNPVQVHVQSADSIGLVQAAEFAGLLKRFDGVVRHIFFGHCHYTLSGRIHGASFSAPRSTNHPCWPDFENKDPRLGFGPLERNYNVCFLTEHDIVVHSIDFQRHRDVRYMSTNESGWVSESEENEVETVA